MLDPGIVSLATRPRLTVVRELPADLETPVSLYLKLRDHEPSYLLESVEGGEHLGRYSFIGLQPSRIVRSWRERVEITDSETSGRYIINDADVLEVLREMLRVGPQATAQPSHQAPGAVGYVGYDVARNIEHLPATADAGLNLPEAVLLFCDVALILDHVKHRLWITAEAPLTQSVADAQAVAAERIEQAIARIRGPLPPQSDRPIGRVERAQSNVTRQQYEDMVRWAKEYIAAGDIFQVVLSQRFTRPSTASPLAIYRTLRRLNPSPYMFFLSLPDDLYLIGSSPEVLVRLRGRLAEQRPLAGTRRRGEDLPRDQALEQELLTDPKERAEHVMLVDLARNDLGRVCRYGSVSVPLLMGVERYSHVMHIVSTVQGELDSQYDAIDLLRACFPAGTVSGAPKVRAMQIIEELEATRRGPYAGAVGHFDYSGDMDMCIAIRTIVMQGQTAYLQAGAGIVADSDPSAEYEETLNKLRALEQAVTMAEQGL